MSGFEAIEILKKWLKEHGHMPGIKWLAQAIKIAVKALEEKQQRRWIPVSERLPDESGFYLIQQEASFMEYMRVARYSTENQKFRNAEVKCYYADVIAWLPLPEPYVQGDY